MASTQVYLVHYFIQDERFIAGKLYHDYVTIAANYGSKFEDIREMIALKKGIVFDDILIKSIELSDIQ